MAQALYNYLASVLRALGDSKRPLYFLVIAALLNIVLDLVFIIVFRMGAAGAAYATVIAQGISGILCLLYIAKKVPALYLHREDWEIDKNLAGWQLKIGLPMAFQYSITAIGTIVVQSCLNILGSTAAAGFAAASKIEQVFTQAYVALGTTMATYCAQNMGAGKYTRIRNIDWIYLCGCDRCDYFLCRKIYDDILCIRECKSDHGICGYLFEVCKRVIPASCYC